MITCDLLGRLGNHLFQTANVINVAEELKSDFVLPTFASAGHYGNIPVDFGGFKYPYVLKDIQTKHSFDQKVFHHVPITLQHDLRLQGFYQCYQYFDAIRPKLIETYFQFNDKVKEAAKKYPIRDDSLGISVRGGDYFLLQQNHNVLQRGYFQNALNEIPSIDNIFIFSDDFKWAEALFYDIKNDLIFVDDDKWVQLYMMTQMKHLIMANSTFSWWGGYLNDRGGKIIIPDQWFGVNNQNLDTSGLYYPKWTRIK